MIRVAVIGAAGYTGGEMVRLLMRHPHVGAKSVVAVSASHAEKLLSVAHPDLSGLTDLVFVEKAPTDADLYVLCLGHGKSAQWLSENDLPLRAKVIDVGHDFRIESSAHTFIYGLPEVHRERIRNATRIANPGCFATAIQLALIPLAEKGLLTADVVVHAITGSTGAGQQPTETTHYMKRVINTNMCHIGLLVRNNSLMVVSVIDNLLKGAAGQAIQNMNLACGFDEAAGLDLKSSVF